MSLYNAIKNIFKNWISKRMPQPRRAWRILQEQHVLNMSHTQHPTTVTGMSGDEPQSLEDDDEEAEEANRPQDCNNPCQGRANTTLHRYKISRRTTKEMLQATLELRSPLLSSSASSLRDSASRSFWAFASLVPPTCAAVREPVLWSKIIKAQQSGQT